MAKNIVHIKTEKELAETVIQFIHISVNMRRAQNYWHEHYGSQALNQKQRWESKMDAFLLNLGVTDHMNIQSLQVLTNGDTYVEMRNKKTDAI
ncbi:MAG: hypothetical protein ABI675_19580 [Chitinophagaceae bacterium]